MTSELVVSLLAQCGLPESAAERTSVVGDEQPYATTFAVVECAAAALAAVGSVASLLWEERTGQAQEVTVSRGHAAASLLGFMYQHLEEPTSLAGDIAPRGLDRPLVGLYPCRDGRWVHLHGALSHLAERTARVLGCDVTASKETVAKRVMLWDAPELEDALARAGTCGAMVRSVEEWAAHPQAQAIAPFGQVSVERIGDSAAEPPGRGTRRPLDGLRVLDLSRILAAPTNGRTLAEHGADVLLVNSPHLENVPAFVMDTSHGKRSCQLDLQQPQEAERLGALAAEADVFSQGYRSGSLARRGFGPTAVAQLRPGIIYVTINCYGDAGPWRDRPGWEQLAQTVSGMADAQGVPGAPELVAAAACDYTTGYLAALGTMAALWRRSHEGGSYHVRASLCQTAGWFTSTEPTSGALSALGNLASYMTRTDTPYGALNHLAPVAQLSATPARWALPTVPIGTHQAAWAT